MDVIIYIGEETTPLGISAPYNLDMDLGGTNDFELSMNYGAWEEITAKYKDYLDWWLEVGAIEVYVPGEEYGGTITEIEGATNTEMVYLRGYTWRGILANKILSPPEGEDYLRMSGKLEDIVNSLIFRADLIYFFNVIRDGTTPTVTNYQFDRYTTLLEGIEKMLASKGYKLEISYSELGGYYEYRDGEIEYNTEGRFPRHIKCVPILDYGSEIEVSQDSKMDFVSNDNRRGCNHLVCLGKGELKDRIVVNLYVDSQDGSITRDDQGYGADEVARVYDNPGAEETDLVEYGTEYLKTLMSKKEFTAKAKYIDDINLGIGDTITGKDLITGTVVTKPIRQKIVKIANGIATVNYKL